MIYITLLAAGVLVSVVHAYLVWKNFDGVRYSLSEHAIADQKSHLLYAITHLVADVLLIIYAFMFFYEAHSQNVLFILTLTFITLDSVQAVLPSKGKTEHIHFASAYVSWFIYQLVGILSLFWLDILQPYLILAIIAFIPVVVMFIYMHFKRSRLWPYQLLMVPMYVLSLFFITAGSA